jgi:hypothetical protein
MYIYASTIVFAVWGHFGCYYCFVMLLHTTPTLPLTPLFRFCVFPLTIKERKNITDERQALKDALTVLEQEGLLLTTTTTTTTTTTNTTTGVAGRGGVPFLSHQDDSTNNVAVPNLGDIAVFGTLRGLEGLPIMDRILSEHDTLLKPWYQQMSSLMKQNKKK